VTYINLSRPKFLAKVKRNRHDFLFSLIDKENIQMLNRKVWNWG